MILFVVFVVMVLIFVIIVALIAVLFTKSKTNDRILLDADLSCVFKVLSSSPKISKPSQDINAPSSANLNFGGSLCGNLELSDIFVSETQQGSNNSGRVYKYTFSSNKGEYSKIYTYQPLNNPLNAKFGNEISVSPDTSWLIITNGTNIVGQVGLYIINVNTVVPDSVGSTISTIAPFENIPLVASNIFSHIAITGSNIFVSATHLLDKMNAVYQLRKFGSDPNFTWDYQVSMMDDLLPVSSIADQQVLCQKVTDRSAITYSLTSIMNTPSSVWEASNIPLASPSVVTSVWADFVSIGACGLYGVVHGLSGVTHSITVISRTTLIEPWVEKNTYYSLNNPSTDFGFGTAIACTSNGGYVVVGEPKASVGNPIKLNRGRVYLYQRIENFELKYIQELEPIDTNHRTTADIYFGSHVLISANESSAINVVVSAPGNGTNGFISNYILKQS